MISNDDGPLRLNVDPRSGHPIYLQILEQVQRAIALGVLRPGEQLPTVKAMSTQLLVNPATITRALRELEHLGLITSYAGRGSFVNTNGTVSSTLQAAEASATASLEAAVREARAFGVPREILNRIFERLAARWYGDDAPKEDQ